MRKRPHRVGAFGIQFVPLLLPKQNSYTITYAPGVVGDGASWKVRIVTKQGGAYLPPVELQPGQSVTLTAQTANDAAFVQAVRLSPSVGGGTYALTVDPGVPPAL